MWEGLALKGSWDDRTTAGWDGGWGVPGGVPWRRWGELPGVYNVSKLRILGSPAFRNVCFFVYVSWEVSLLQVVNMRCWETNGSDNCMKLETQLQLCFFSMLFLS